MQKNRENLIRDATLANMVNEFNNLKGQLNDI